jgi:hypothetical protein
MQAKDFFHVLARERVGVGATAAVVGVLEEEGFAGGDLLDCACLLEDILDLLQRG